MAWYAVAWCLLWAVGIAALDLRTQRIPNLALIGFWLPGVIWLAWTGQGLLQFGWVFAVAGLVLALCMLLPGYWLNMLGGGDVKYAAVIGFYIGPVAVLLMLAIGAPLWWVAQTWQGRRRGAGSALPMGPVLAAGACLGWPLSLWWLAG